MISQEPVMTTFEHTLARALTEFVSCSRAGIGHAALVTGAQTHCLNQER